MGEHTERQSERGLHSLGSGVAAVSGVEDGSSHDAGGPATEARLLGFYDRLRERIVAAAERKGGRMGVATTRTLLLAPDLFILLARLSLDREVPQASRALFAGALAYFILPTDLLPEAVIGVGGFLDDVILAAGVLAHAFGDELEPLAQKYWSGSQDLRLTLRDLSQAAHSLLGEDLYSRLRSFLRKRGIEMEEGGAESADRAP